MKTANMSPNSIPTKIKPMPPSNKRRRALSGPRCVGELEIFIAAFVVYGCSRVYPAGRVKFRDKFIFPHMWPKRQSVDQLGSLESELMQRVWARGEISVRDLHSEVAERLAYTTI